MGLGRNNPETILSLSAERSPSPCELLGASGWRSEEGCGGKDTLHLAVHPRSEGCLCSEFPVMRSRSWMLGTRVQPEDMGLGLGGH